MNNGSNDSFNFKPHELTYSNSPWNYYGLAWQFNYQKNNLFTATNIGGLFANT